MRRIAVLSGIVGMALAAAGCVMVIGTERSVTDLPDSKKIVEIDNELYLVDLKTKKVRKLDKDAIVHSETTITTDESDGD